MRALIDNRLDVIATRIEFNEDELESIRTFDINTQLSIENHKNILIIPNTRTSFIKYFIISWKPAKCIFKISL